MDTLQDLTQKSLARFRVAEMTEIYRIDDQGKEVESIGLLENAEFAEGYIVGLTDARYHRTRRVFVLTNSIVVFPFKGAATLLDPEKIKKHIKEKALKKLSPIERIIMSA